MGMGSCPPREVLIVIDFRVIFAMFLASSI